MAPGTDPSCCGPVLTPGSSVPTPSSLARSLPDLTPGPLGQTGRGSLCPSSCFWCAWTSWPGVSGAGRSGEGCQRVGEQCPPASFSSGSTVGAGQQLGPCGPVEGAAVPSLGPIPGQREERLSVGGRCPPPSTVVPGGVFEGNPSFPRHSDTPVDPPTHAGSPVLMSWAGYSQPPCRITPLQATKLPAHLADIFGPHFALRHEGEGTPVLPAHCPGFRSPRPLAEPALCRLAQGLH